MRLLVFNLATDADDPALGFGVAWLDALARQCAYLDVITMRVGYYQLPPNVRVFSVGKERGYGEARRAFEFYRILALLLRERTYDACFAHMMPLFAVMGAPLLKLRGIPITLWFMHSAVPLKLRIAEKLADHVVTASAESFRLQSAKLIILSHGIQTDLFVPAPSRPERPFTVVSVGRIAPSKQQHLIIKAANRLADQGIVFRIIGEAEPQHRDYAAQVRQAAGTNVEFVGAVRHEDVVSVYHNADVMVNMSLTGSLDKAVLEAMSAGIPVVTGNEAFRSILARWADILLVPPDDADALANRVSTLASWSPDERAALGDELRPLVVAGHGLERLIDRLLEVMSNE